MNSELMVGAGLHGISLSVVPGRREARCCGSRLEHLWSGGDARIARVAGNK